MFASLYQNAQPEELDGFLRILLVQYGEPGRVNDDSAFVLLDTMCDLPLDGCSEAELKNLAGFASYYYLREPSRLHIAAGRFLMRLTAALPAGHPLAAPILRLVETLPPRPGATELFLRCFTLKNLGREVDALEQRLAQSETTSEVFLENLKAGTPWIAIAVNVELLAYQAETGRPEQLLHIATHLCNLLKVSEFIGVRKEAGQVLLRLAPRLTTDQRNEIAIELLKALETGDYTFSKYIPPYLGRLALTLPAAQRSELLAALKADLAAANERVVNVALDTVEAMLAGSGALPAGEDLQRGEMMGVLLTGLAHYQEGVRQNALRLFGQLFADRELGLAERHELLGLCLQKLLTLMGPVQENSVPDGLTRYYSTAALTHLWRFVAEYQIDHGTPKLALRDKVAFFPGTFDPFTLSHKGIVEAIERLGYEVYLAVDEFSWSKNSQPHLLRSRIVQMSVADMFHVHLFPDEIPVNIANPADLARLRKAFPDRELYLVVGADVLRSASAYKAAPRPGCVLEFDHIVFRRQEEPGGATQRIAGKVIELELPPHLEQVSSTRIRENVDSNRDISALTDPLVQEFIYQQGLYLREPRFKPVQSNCPVILQQFAAGETEHAEGIAFALLEDPARREAFLRRAQQNRMDLVVLRSSDDMRRACGCMCQRVLESTGLMEALGRIDWADQVRSRAVGRILLIEPPLMRPGSAVPDADHLLLTEGLLRGVQQGCGFAVCRLDGAPAEQKLLLRRQGFVPLEGSDETVWMVDLRRPLVLMQNIEGSIKPPFDREPQLRQLISALRCRLQLTLAGMVPGQWVLALWAPLVLQQLMDRTTALNGVPAQPSQPRRLGPAMCVPFGKILRERLVPNTVTKTLRTDRVFSPDLHTDTIEAFPGYPSLKSQLRILRSFDRPVILVDDLLHQEGRLQRLLPLLREEGIPLQQVLVGILTDHGRDSIAQADIPVDAVYRLPGLRQWLLESSLYPFVGGDTIQRGEDYRLLGLRPSINRIYPYAAPDLPGCGKEAQLIFSRCGLECARDLFLLLERLYRSQYGRGLTLGRLNEAIVLPLCPDRGRCVRYDETLSPSLYLEQDLQLLHRCFELC